MGAILVRLIQGELCDWTINFTNLVFISQIISPIVFKASCSISLSLTLAIPFVYGFIF